MQKKKVTYFHGKFVKLGDVAKKEIDFFFHGKFVNLGVLQKNIDCSHGKCMKFAGDVAEKKGGKNDCFHENS